MASLFCVIVLLLTTIWWGIAPVDQPVNVSMVHIGVILDQGSLFGMVSNSTIRMALDDFYAKPGNKTRLMLHGRDSNGSITGAASAALQLMNESKVQAIIGPETSEQANFLSYMGNEAHIPIISFSAISSTLSPSKIPYFVRMAQNDSSQAKVIAAVVHAFGWKEVVVVHEDSSSAIGLIPYLSDAMEEINAKVHHRVVLPSKANKNVILGTLTKLAQMGPRVFVLHTSFSLCKRFFIHTHNFGMMADGYVWIITSELANHLAYMNSTVINSMKGVLGVKSYVPESKQLDDFKVRWKEQFRREHPEKEVVDVDVYALWAYDTTLLIAMAAENVSFQYHESMHSIDLLGLDVSSSNGESFLQSILNTKIRGLTGDIQLVDGQLQSNDFQIVNVLGNGAREIGYWNPETGLSKNPMDMKKNYSADMKDIEAVIWPGGSTMVPKGWAFGPYLSVGVPVKTGFEEFMKVVKNPLDNTTIATGFAVDVFEKVMGLLDPQFRYEYIPFENGHEGEPGYYNELIYQVYLKKYDAVVGDTTIIANRSNYVDFTQPYAETGVSMIVPIKNDDVTSSWWWFTKPFKWDLWLTIFLFFVGKGFLVWAFEREKNKNYKGTLPQQLGLAQFYSFSLFVFPNGHKLKSKYSRMVVIASTLMILILVTSYNANLTSMVTVEKLRPAITDMDSLARNGDYVGYPNGSFLYEELKNMGFQQEKLKPYATAEEYAEALSRGSSNNGVSAIIDEVPYIRIFLSKYCHQYTMAGRIYRTGGFGFVFPKGFDMLPDISRAVLQFSESKDMFDVENKWFGQASTCPDLLETSVTNNKLTLKSFRSIFIFVGAVVIGASLSFIIEPCFGQACAEAQPEESTATDQSLPERIPDHRIELDDNANGEREGNSERLRDGHPGTESITPSSESNSEIQMPIQQEPDSSART